FRQFDDGSAAAGPVVRALIGACGYALDGESADAERVAEAGGDLLKLKDALGVGLLMNAVEAGDVALLKVRGYGFIGGKHELFNEAVSPVALRGRDAFH